MSGLTYTKLKINKVFRGFNMKVLDGARVYIPEVLCKCSAYSGFKDAIAPGILNGNVHTDRDILPLDSVTVVVFSAP